MGTQERRAREKELRRRQILDAARKLFWKNGYTATTMPDIARAAELAPGTLYLYFPGKGALYTELLVEGYDQLIPRLESRIDPAAPPHNQAESLIDAFFDFARDCPEVFNIIFFLLQQEGRGPRQEALEPQLLERLQAREAACKAIAARVLERIADLPADQIHRRVDAIWSMLAGVVFFFRGDGPQAVAQVAREARDLILKAHFERR